MTIKAMIMVLCLTSSAWAFAQICPYDPKLEWSDFMEVPDNPDNEEDAQTTSGTNPQWSVSVKRDGDGYKATVEATVTSEFDKGSSWVEKGAKTPELLEHEQYHMDISEYWARQMQEALNGIEQTGATPDDALDLAAAEAQRVEDHMNNKCDELQDQYDEETEHGKNKDKQAEWCEKVKNWLKSTDVDTPKSEGDQTQMFYVADEGAVSINSAAITGFSYNNEPLIDPVFQGAVVQWPAMDYGGNRMGHPYFNQTSHADALQVVSGDGEVLLQGVINLMIGDVAGTMFCGQVTEVEILTTASTPFLQAIADTAGRGQGVMAVGLHLSEPAADSTNDWRGDAQLDAIVTLGVSRPTNPCDVNCDGSVDLRDQQAMRDILAGKTVSCSHNGGDIDGDGEITELDGLLLQSCLPEVNPVDLESLNMKQR